MFFRLASSALFSHPPYQEGYGGNMQNPSESLMRCVIPDEGMIFLSADQEGAEAKIVAYEAPKGDFRGLFDAGIKPHQYVAVDIFLDDYQREFFPNKPKAYFEALRPPLVAGLDEWRPMVKTLKDIYEVRYFLGKKTCHSGNYDVGPATFVASVLEETEGAINLPIEKGKEFGNRYRMRFPEIPEWQSECRATVKRTGRLYNLLGHPITFTRRIHEANERELYAAVPQSTVGEITNLAWIELQEFIQNDNLPWDLLNNKHDSILLQVPNNKEHVEMGYHALKRHLGRELRSTKGEDFVMGTEVSYGFNWGKHSADNPNGMKVFKL